MIVVFFEPLLRRRSKMSIPSQVVISLYSKDVNLLSVVNIHAYSSKIGMDEGTMAYWSVKPDRLILHHLLAQLVTRTQIANKTKLAETIDGLTAKYHELFPGKAKLYLEQLEQKIKDFNALFETYTKEQNFFSYPPQNSEEASVLLSAKTFYTQIKNNPNIDSKSSNPLSTESDAEIALLIAIYKQHHREIAYEIKQDITHLVQEAIDKKMLLALDLIPIHQQKFFGITGPIASGKSYSKTKTTEKLNQQPAAFISSDEWHSILMKALNLNSEQKKCGQLTLSEAWFIKKLMWKVLKELNQKQQGIHIIQEAMSPFRLNIPTEGTVTIFINTAMPEKALFRLKVRENLLGRSVSSAKTFQSYRWPWLNLVEVLHHDLVNKSNFSLKIIDTDAVHIYKNQSEASCEQASTIATLEQGILNIHHLERFISLIIRGTLINPAAKGPEDGWLKAQVNQQKLKEELEKIFNSPYKLTIKLWEKTLDLEQLLSEMLRKITATKAIQQFFRSQQKKESSLHIGLSKSLTL